MTIYYAAPTDRGTGDGSSEANAIALATIMRDSSLQDGDKIFATNQHGEYSINSSDFSPQAGSCFETSTSGSASGGWIAVIG